MEGYKIYNYQKEVLAQQIRPDGSKYNPVQDINGDWFIFKQEYNDCGLGEKAEYVPPITEI